MKKLDSVSQHTEYYYFNLKKVQFPLCTAVKSVHINKGATVQPGKAARDPLHTGGVRIGQ